ncbi:ATP-binding protein [Nonomuraea mesophila]|uniref:histidine kinase n=1 Tax=Nonomuraea mesophila TaxID=2530382 RepID=A0A4R5FMF6_9ACTN|nr:ATP-binding protein [Nonomuraea mesophila]TDE54092.1 ATP-binding protein [Nonomuraea mesophila]
MYQGHLMSAPSLPSTAPERQDAGGRGRPRGRGKRRPLNVRAFHLWASVLPAALMAALGLGAVAVLILTSPSTPQAWSTLAVMVGGMVAIMCVAIVAADKAAQREHQISDRSAARFREVETRLASLGFLISRGRQELQRLAERIAAGEVPARRGVDFQPMATGGSFTQLEAEVQEAQNEAWNAVITAASRRTNNRPAHQPVEVFVNLALRMQSLSHRAMRGLDELENQVEDPELLKGLFRVDHLSTRLRRQAESLAVIGGAVPRRQWSKPVATYEILRSAIAEVEYFSRVKVVPPVEGAVDGAAAADIIHLLAELVENATKFSPPHTQVLLHAETVTAGLAIEIEDRGLGMTRDTQRRLNDILAAPERTDIDELVQDGRIGLLVVSALSRRHKIVVKVQTNIYGGTQTIVVIPNELLNVETQEPVSRQPASAEPSDRAPAAPPAPAPAVPPSPGASAPGSLFSPKSSAASRQEAAVPGPGARPDVPPETRRKQSAGQSAGPPARHVEKRPDAGPPRGAGQRPELPRRRPQTNMAPGLRNAPAQLDDDTDLNLDHGLMASFTNGMRSGQDEDTRDETGHSSL